MSRTKEFDEKEVLQKALGLFRERGFKQTSFADLTAHLGVSRQSLYDTFGDKQALYQMALTSYLESGLDNIRQCLSSDAPIREVMGKFFSNLISGNCANGSHGCPMINAMVELAPLDGDTRALAQRHARELENIIASRLSTAQRAGEISSDKDPISLARFFYSTVLGLSVSSRALGDRESLLQTCQLALKILD